MIDKHNTITKKMINTFLNLFSGLSNIYGTADRDYKNTKVVKAIGADRLECLVLSRKNAMEEETVPTNHLFIFIGAKPNTDWLGNQIKRDSRGFILSGTDLGNNERKVSISNQVRAPYLLETSSKGIFVAGDVRHGSVKRVASAVGEGAMAVTLIHRYLNEV